MSFLETKRTMGFKTEGTAYTVETLAVTDHDVPFYNISYDPDIQMYARKLARGDMSRDPSIAGKRPITFTMSHDIAWSNSLPVAPSWYKCLQSCAMKETVHGTTGVSLITHSGYSKVPATIEVVEKDEGATPVQVVIKARGCMGNAKLIVDTVGNPMRIDYEFKGVLESITDRAYASILTPTGFDTPLPDAVMGITSKLFTEVQTWDTCTIDLGNVVENYSDPSKTGGIQGAHVVDRNPTVEMDPDMDLIANRGDYARQIGNSTGALVMEVGDYFHLSAPALQYISTYKPGSREGHVTNQKTCELKRGPDGNDEFEILQGSKA